MIIQRRTDGRLFCIRQTSHALMASALCRRWGNAEFAPPPLGNVTLMAVNQHDGGWYEWEQAPKLNVDGTPQDFMHDDEPLAKLDLWRRAIERTAAQHPFAGVLVSRHAQRLSRGALDDASLGPTVHGATAHFLAEEAARVEQIERELQPLFTARQIGFEQAAGAGERLLAFGDTATLQVTVPWSPRRVLRDCPVDWAADCPANGPDAFTDIAMIHETGDRGGTISFSPWPFGVEAFALSVHGRLLEQHAFADETAYHAALAAAPLHEQRWTVMPAA